MKRIYLRAFEPEDYLLINQWRCDPDISQTLGGNFNYVSLEREKQWVAEKSVNDKFHIYLAICLIKENRMIGYTSINNIDSRNLKAEWGGTIIGCKDLWGKGYATEAAKMMLHYLFTQYPMHKCYAYCLQEHRVTEKLFISLGFTFEGVIRDDVFKNNMYKSKLLFSILRDEYMAKYENELV